MKFARAAETLGLTVLAAAFGSAALAQGATGGGGGGGSGAGASGMSPTAWGSEWYGGFSIGRSRANIDEARIAGGLLGAGFVTTSISDDDRDTGYKAFGGYRFHRNFAIEGGYYNLGKFGFTATTAAPNAGTLTGTIKLQGLNLDAVGIWPINERFSAFGRAGFAYTQARDTFTGTGAVAVLNRNPRKSDMNYKVGIGLQYDFTPALAMRVEAERYRIDDAVGNKGDIDLLSVGLLYRFGGKSSFTGSR